MDERIRPGASLALGFDRPFKRQVLSRKRSSDIDVGTGHPLDPQRRPVANTTKSERGPERLSRRHVWRQERVRFGCYGGAYCAIARWSFGAICPKRPLLKSSTASRISSVVFMTVDARVKLTHFR
jgi:hypothetical protein